MNFDSEDDLRQAYRETSSNSFESEEPVGHEVIKERTPPGLGGARCPQADLLGKAPQSGPHSHTLVECKLDFELRGIGQLLFYNQLLQHELQVKSDSEVRIERRLVLGSAPPDVIPSVCSDLGLTLEIPVQEDWQEVTRSDTPDVDAGRSDLTPVVQWMRETQSRQLKSAAEEQVLQEFLSTHLPDITEEALYREIRVGNQRFSEVNSEFRADAIGHVPSTDQLYVIEVKDEPEVGGLFKALGQAVTYASLLRQDWNLAVEQVIPTVLIDRAPWHTDLYWETMDGEAPEEIERQMMRNAVSNSDSVVLFCNQIERYQ